MLYELFTSTIILFLSCALGVLKRGICGDTLPHSPAFFFFFLNIRTVINGFIK